MNAMAAAAAAALPDVDDIDLGFLDGLDFDLGSFDDLAEFCLGDDAVGAAADGDKEGGLGLCLSDSDDSDDESSDCSGREGSPDSVVTDDGAAPLSSTGPADLDLDGGDSMSAYVSELERFLMEDEEEEAGGRATATEGELAADQHKYFFGHLLAEDDGCVRLAAGAGSKEEEEEDDEEEEEDVAAREDEATSRKRASTSSIHPLGQRRSAGAAVPLLGPSEAELGATTRRTPIERGCRHHRRLPPLLGRAQGSSVWLSA